MVRTERLIISSDEEELDNGTTATTTRDQTTAPTSVANSRKGNDRSEGSIVADDSEAEHDDERLSASIVSSRSTPRRTSAIQASKRLALPTTMDLFDAAYNSDAADDNDVDADGQESDGDTKMKRVASSSKSKGKRKMVILSSDDEAFTYGDVQMILDHDDAGGAGLMDNEGESHHFATSSKSTTQSFSASTAPGNLSRRASSTTTRLVVVQKSRRSKASLSKKRKEQLSGSEFSLDGADDVADETDEGEESNASEQDEKPPRTTATIRNAAPKAMRKPRSKDEGNDDGEEEDDEDRDSEGAEVEDELDDDEEEDEQTMHKVGAGGVKSVGRKPRKGAIIPASMIKEMKKMTRYQKTEVQLKANHNELINCWDEVFAIPVRSPSRADQPVGLTLKLLPFQQEGLEWMKNQEKSVWGGGLLADEMGMGKTIQTIALILSDYERDVTKCTLVLAPTVALIQWKNEIAKFTTGIKVLVFHGASRIDNTRDMSKYDVVLTSYGIMESSYRREIKGFMKKGVLHKEDSIVHKMKWHRVILDESHAIKDRGSNQAKAAFALTSRFRWCLSGTPLQNRVGELYSLIRFLGADPFAYYFCKKCDCKSLHWLSNKGPCSECRHSGMQHVCYWNAEVLKPIQFGGATEGEGGAAFAKLQTLLSRMMLRRTKVERADDMGLPPRVVRVRRDYFTEEEEEVYKSLYQDVARKFNTYASEGTLLNNYTNLFTLITRMRQAADHVLLCLKSTTAAPVQHALDDIPENILTCRLCLDEAEEAIVSSCKHTFCRECIRQYMETAMEQSPECPVCRTHLTIDLAQDAIEVGHENAPRQGFLARIDPSKYRSSTKIEALVEELSKLRTQDSTIKSLVFSQFTSMLDLVERRLQLGGFKTARLQGSMTPTKRDAVIQHFTNTPSCTVFLISLKAGGVALNLTEASSVFLLDPWWNPAVELQAMDRIHRISQHRPVVVTRLIIENSIESRILELQQKKTAMSSSTLGDDSSAMGRLTPADLEFLFNL